MTREEALQIAKPILFNTKMVRAIQNNRKTVTRRVVKSKNVDLSTCSFVEMSIDPFELRIDRNRMEYPHDLKGLYATFEQDGGEYFPLVKAPYEVGDVLYIRETWGEIGGVDDREYIYRADDDMGTDRWHPSIHMPLEAARIFLRVTGVRVERLQDITDEQIKHEGIYLREEDSDGEWQWWSWGSDYQCTSLKLCYRKLWNNTIKKSDLAKYGWNANPWVFVIEFERVEVTE